MLPLPMISSDSQIGNKLLRNYCFNIGKSWKWHCCRKGDPFQGLKLGSCLTLGNELSEETHVLAKPETLLGKGIRAESRRVREPRRTALPHGLSLMVLW